MAKDQSMKEEEEEEEYEVEHVVDDRILHKKKQYYIKWKNYSSSDNTWEPEDNLNCPELIAAYERKKSEKNKKEEKKEEVTEKVEEEGRRPRSTSVSTKGVKRSSSVSSVKSTSSKRPKSVSNGTVKKEKVEEPKIQGFARGLQPAKIVGATEKDGELKFLVKWEGCNESDMVPAKEANVKCPQHVIDFYEDRLTWHSVDDRSKK